MKRDNNAQSVRIVTGDAIIMEQVSTRKYVKWLTEVHTSSESQWRAHCQGALYPDSKHGREGTRNVWEAIGVWAELFSMCKYNQPGKDEKRHPVDQIGSLDLKKLRGDAEEESGLDAKGARRVAES